jgi:hypothetical protein
MSHKAGQNLAWAGRHGLETILNAGRHQSIAKRDSVNVLAEMFHIETRAPVLRCSLYVKTYNTKPNIGSPLWSSG